MDDQNQNPDAAAQAAAAAEAAAKAAGKPAGADLNVMPEKEYVLTPSGDPATDIAFKFLATNGVVPGTPAWEAAQKGDFTVAKAALAAAGVKGATEYVAILEDRAAKAVEAAKAKQAVVQKAVHEAVGGQEQWTTIKDWVAANADDEELEAVNAALKGGAFMAKIMAEGLAARYARATGSAQGTEPTAFRQMPQARSAPTGPAPLSATEYRTEVEKLRQKFGFNLDKTPEFQALRQRRALGLASEQRR